jgi:hypothetical protein
MKPQTQEDSYTHQIRVPKIGVTLNLGSNLQHEALSPEPLILVTRKPFSLNPNQPLISTPPRPFISNTTLDLSLSVEVI